MNVSNACDSIPVFPTLPISSLSAIMHTAVLLILFNSIIAVNDVYTLTLSSCPYAATILSSKPCVLALYAGTNSNSELAKSSSTIPYLLFNIAKIFSFTLSGISSSKGILPIKRFKSSPFIASFNFKFSCSFAKCGNKSVTVKIGSLSSSPIFTSIFSPFPFTITP